MNVLACISLIIASSRLLGPRIFPAKHGKTNSPLFPTHFRIRHTNTSSSYVPTPERPIFRLLSLIATYLLFLSHKKGKKHLFWFLSIKRASLLPRFLVLGVCVCEAWARKWGTHYRFNAHTLLYSSFLFWGGEICTNIQVHSVLHATVGGRKQGGGVRLFLSFFLGRGATCKRRDSMGCGSGYSSKKGILQGRGKTTSRDGWLRRLGLRARTNERGGRGNERDSIDLKP